MSVRVLVLALASICLVTANASAQQPVTLASNFNARPLCIDVPNNQYKAGTQLIVYPCQRSPNQYFTFTQYGIVAGNTQLCVDAFRPGGGASRIGDVIGLWSCQHSPNQSWFLSAAVVTPPGQTPAIFSLIVQAGLCMEVTGYDPQRQVGRLVLNRCTSSPSQQFRFY